MPTILMMTIDRLEPAPLQEHVFRIHLSDGTVIKTQDYVIADLGLYPGLEVDEEKLRQLQAAAGQRNSLRCASLQRSTAACGNDAPICSLPFPLMRQHRLPYTPAAQPLQSLVHTPALQAVTPAGTKGYLGVAEHRHAKQIFPMTDTLFRSKA